MSCSSNRRPFPFQEWPAQGGSNAGSALRLRHQNAPRMLAAKAACVPGVFALCCRCMVRVLSVCEPVCWASRLTANHARKMRARPRRAAEGLRVVRRSRVRVIFAGALDALGMRAHPGKRIGFA